MVLWWVSINSQIWQKLNLLLRKASGNILLSVDAWKFQKDHIITTTSADIMAISSHLKRKASTWMTITGWITRDSVWELIGLRGEKFRVLKTSSLVGLVGPTLLTLFSKLNMLLRTVQSGRKTCLFFRNNNWSTATGCLIWAVWAERRTMRCDMWKREVLVWRKIILMRIDGENAGMIKKACLLIQFPRSSTSKNCGTKTSNTLSAKEQ